MNPRYEIRAKSEVFIYEDPVGSGKYRAAPSPFVVGEADHKLQFRNMASVPITLDVSSFSNTGPITLGAKGSGSDKGQVEVRNNAGVFEYSANPTVEGNSGPKVVVDL